MVVAIVSVVLAVLRLRELVEEVGKKIGGKKIFRIER